MVYMVNWFNNKSRNHTLASSMLFISLSLLVYLIYENNSIKTIVESCCLRNQEFFIFSERNGVTSSILMFSHPESRSSRFSAPAFVSTCLKPDSLPPSMYLMAEIQKYLKPRSHVYSCDLDLHRITPMTLWSLIWTRNDTRSYEK